MKEKELEYYGEYAQGLMRIEAGIRERLFAIAEGIKESTGEAAVEHIRSRIKSADSLREKLQRKSVPTDVRAALDTVSDLIGFRIVTHFVGEVYELENSIKDCSLWRVTKIKDYISDPKPNGYRSLHMIIGVSPEVFMAELPGIDEIELEIQLRTIAMDCWASLEHEMKYKKNIPEEKLIINELKRCADEMASTDLTMQTIRDMIREEK